MLPRVNGISPVVGSALPVLLLACLPPGDVRGSEPIRREMGNFAAKIKAVLTEEGQDSIAIGEFTGPAGFNASAGPAMQKMFIDAFETAGVSIKRRALVSVKGEYLIVEDQRDRDRIVLRLLAVVRRRGSKLLDLQADIRSNVDLVRTLGLTVKLPVRGDAASRNEVIKKAVDEGDKATTAGTKVKVEPGSPYAVEILVGGRARAAALKDGQAFVPIRRGEVYAIKVYNKSPHEAAVSVTIDGLSVFTFSSVKDTKGQPKYTHFIVSPGKSFTVVGWHRTNKSSDSFKVTEFADSAVAKALTGSQKVGTITVNFHAAWEGDNVPADEKGARGAGDATGFGPPKKTDLREVSRHIGVLREAVSVRYTKP